MKFSRGCMALLMVVFLLGMFPAAKPAAAQSGTPLPEGTYVPGELVVVLDGKTGASGPASQARALAGSVGAAVAASYGDMALLSADPQADVAALAAQVSSLPGVVYAQPNYIYSLPESKGGAAQGGTQSAYVIDSPNGLDVRMSWEQVAGLRTIVKKGTRSAAIPSFPKELLSGNLWAWDRIQADLIWGEKLVAPLVCLLDTGVDAKHPDLTGVVVSGPDFYNNDKKPDDDNGHGTHVAGIIAGRANTNASSTVGVSNGKVLAVKVLNAQGIGTTFSVTAGIKFCGANKSVKIINMSLGSYLADKVQYQALETALIGRLLVAAAGNESVSGRFYPAAYADPEVTAPESFNNIASQVISVAAARSPFSPYPLWVDKDGDGVVHPDGSEIFLPEQCASGNSNENGIATGSNYGRWVTMVAPGEDVYSTTPVSNPFYLNSYQPQLSSGYDFMSGTSQAAALVAGSAARVWSLLPKTELNPPKKVKDTLVALSEPLQFASDNTPGVMAEVGYGSPTNSFDLHGETIWYGKPYDHDDDPSTTMIMKAPYCWPASNDNFGDDERMDGFTYGAGKVKLAAVYLNVARAMQRAALAVEVKDATNGSPIAGAFVAAHDISGSTPVLRDKTKTEKGGSVVVLTNLPASETGIKYRLSVSMAGYTTGYQPFNEVNLSGDLRGMALNDVYNRVSLASKNNINFILDWVDPTINPAQGRVDPDADLDMYLLLPREGVNGDQGGIIGTEMGWGASPKLLTYIPGKQDVFVGAGSLINGEALGYPFSPYAQHGFDGGYYYGQDNYGQPLSPVEFISVLPKVKQSAAPYMLPWYNGEYRVVVTDYHRPDAIGGSSQSPKTVGYLSATTTSPNFTAAVVRMWAGGKVVTSVRLQDAAVGINGCNENKDWWKVLQVNGANVSVNNSCDIGLGGVDPY